MILLQNIFQNHSNSQINFTFFIYFNRPLTGLVSSLFHSIVFSLTHVGISVPLSYNVYPDPIRNSSLKVLLLNLVNPDKLNFSSDLLYVNFL